LNVGKLCPSNRRNAIAATQISLNTADIAFGAPAKGAALFAVPIAAPGDASIAGPNSDRAPGSFSRILCGYFQNGCAGSIGVIISLASPDREPASGARMINVSLETVIVQASTDSAAGESICVSSARRGGATLFSFASDEFHGAMLSVDAELGYRLARNSNLRRLTGDAAVATFSINIVSPSTRFLEPSSTGLMAMVLLAPGIFAYKQGAAQGAWRAQQQLDTPQLPAPEPENMWDRLSGKMALLLGR
jgi:hypothetical protein